MDLKAASASCIPVLHGRVLAETSSGLLVRWGRWVDHGCRDGGAGWAGRLRGMMSARAVATGLPGRLECVFTVLRLLSMGDRAKDVEILAPRHQITVLERQLGQRPVRFTAADRALLAALLHRLPRQALQRLRLLERPDTVLHWHRDLTASPHAARSRPKRPGQPRTARSIRVLVLRLARMPPELHG